MQFSQDIIDEQWLLSRSQSLVCINYIFRKRSAENDPIAIYQCTLLYFEITIRNANIIFITIETY